VPGQKPLCYRVRNCLILRPGLLVFLLGHKLDHFSSGMADDHSACAPCVTGQFQCLTSALVTLAGVQRLRFAFSPMGEYRYIDIYEDRRSEPVNWASIGSEWGTRQSIDGIFAEDSSSIFYWHQNGLQAEQGLFRAGIHLPETSRPIGTVRFLL